MKLKNRHLTTLFYENNPKMNIGAGSYPRPHPTRPIFTLHGYENNQNITSNSNKKTGLLTSFFP
jgi:hypothetical protein